MCFARVDLTIERVDETPMYVYHRCPVCEQWFTIRRVDLERLRQPAGERASDVEPSAG